MVPETHQTLHVSISEVNHIAENLLQPATLLDGERRNAHRNASHRSTKYTLGHLESLHRSINGRKIHRGDGGAHVHAFAWGSQEEIVICFDRREGASTYAPAGLTLATCKTSLSVSDSAMTISKLELTDASWDSS